MWLTLQVWCPPIFLVVPGKQKTTFPISIILGRNKGLVWPKFLMKSKIYHFQVKEHYEPRTVYLFTSPDKLIVEVLWFFLPYLLVYNCFTMLCYFLQPKKKRKKIGSFVVLLMKLKSVIQSEKVRKRKTNIVH